MLSLQHIREDPDAVREGIRRKHQDAPVDELLKRDREARRLRAGVEAARAEQHRASASMRGAPSPEQRERLGALKRQIQDDETQLAEIDTDIARLLLEIPNPPHDSVPAGDGPEDNVVVRTWGAPPVFDFAPRAHYEIGEALRIFDFERAAKLSGARFALLQGGGSRLLRALTSFMIDLAAREHGYTEVSPPYLVRRDAMVGSGQLPKFAADAYRTDDDLFLIPTSEVALANLYRDEILEAQQLPIALTALTPCWRREAGAAGKDTRGYVRLHQFDKVEMVRFTTPESSLDELELMTKHAETVLQRLGIHHRVVLLCSAEMGFTQWKTYDVEAWAPGMGRWLEVSSCSACADFQSRRANIRFRVATGERPQFVHTLNGSALGVPRTFDALLETFQLADASIAIPDVLRPYMDGQERLTAGG